MVPNDLIALISGPAGALALLTVGFAVFARLVLVGLKMVLTGALVPGRYYDMVVKENLYLREKLDASLDTTDRTLDKVAPSSSRVSRRET